MKMTKGKEKIEVKDPVQIRAFIKAGWEQDEKEAAAEKAAAEKAAKEAAEKAGK